MANSETTIGGRQRLSFEDETRFINEWEALGLNVRWARALVWNGILTLDELRNASDQELSTMPNVARRGLKQICALIGRKPPGNAKMPEEAQAAYEQAWRAKIGDEAFERILDLIVDMAGDALDRPSIAGGQALWAAARRRRGLAESRHDRLRARPRKGA